ncbi:homeobox protein OTX1 B-like [Trichosurus vulpecula]|uniref:homeobox protein OTX1 B-like n=1 Tax=Trichosurus vulpecula TaxID=9337 RepID=UPI00186AD89D|nr:homeobox protein OTX1 B-like [Trichosurus vulpecula]
MGFTIEQIGILVDYYEKKPYPTLREREELAARLNVDKLRLWVWFRNRRYRKKQKQPLLAFTCSRKQIEWENPSQSEILEENELSPPDTSRSPSQPDELGLQLHNLPRPVSQGSSSRCASSWALQGTQRPENHGTHTSFYGGVKPPFPCQQQGWTTGQLSSHYHPLPFQCAQEPPSQLHQPYPQQPHTQQPPALLPLVPQTPTFQVQQLTSSLHQSPQEHQIQTRSPPLMREEEQPDELLPSSEQQELQLINLYERAVGIGPTMLLPEGHLAAHPGDLDTILRDLDDILKGPTFPQGHMTAETLDAMYKQINDLLAVFND